MFDQRQKWATAYISSNNGDNHDTQEIDPQLNNNNFQDSADENYTSYKDNNEGGIDN